MKLRRIELDQFRRFTRPVVLDGFGDGVNVLAAPNEFGKSTILAAIRALLFERYNSAATAVKSMVPRGSATSPRLAMEFDIGGEHGGGAHWRIEKTFLGRAPSALLVSPEGHRFEGDAAEDRLRALLGSEAPGNRGVKEENLGIWAALWVEQGKSFTQAALEENARARGTITECLTAEVGALTGTEQGQAMLAELQRQISDFLDGRGKPKGRYKTLGEQGEKNAADLDSLRARHSALDDNVRALQEAESRKARLADAAQDATDLRDLAAARLSRDAALAAEDKRTIAQQAVMAAQTARDAARAERDRRTTHAEALQAAEVAERMAVEAASRAAAEEAESAANHGAAQARLLTARAAEDDAVRKREAARRGAELDQAARQLTARQAALETAHAAQAEVNRITATLAALRVDQKAIEALRRAMAAREAAAAALRAQATEIRLDLLPEAAGRVSVDGHPADSATLHVVADTVIEIAGIGRILVRPVIADAAALRDRLAKSEATLSAALARLGLDDVTAAEAQFAAWQATQTELDAAQARLASQVPGDAAAGLAPGIAALQAWVDVQARILADAHDAEAPTVELAEALLAAATRDSRAATEAEAAQGAALNQARLALNTASGRAEQAANEVGRLRREAEQAAARETDEALASREEAGNERLQRAAEELRAVRAAQPEESVDALAARIRRLEQGRAARQEERAATDLRIAELRTRIAASGGEGLEEQIAEAERLEEVLRADRAAIESELAVLTYLRDALQQAERAARQHFLAPVAQHMAPYLHRLFPGAGIECDEAFAITHITRGGGAEEFKTLSDGTQEQIAVLTRLAFADLLIERGSPAMVILDDALAYADADRMERMFDVLAQAGERMQILVLTCREDLFLRLGGTRLALRDAALVA